MVFWICIIVFCINGYLQAGPVPSQLQGGAPYLPPLPESTPEYAKEVLKNTNTISYKTNHNSQNTLENIPQLKSESSYSRTYHNSYAPQPSGIGNQILLPPLEPLPSLIPSTVLNQLKSTSSTTYPSLINNSIVNSSFSNNDENSLLPPSIVMVDSSMEVLTPSQNQTIIAAKLLASSLLQETEDNSSSEFGEVNNLELNDEKKFSPKDMYIVKAQKNAYIVPNNLNKMDIQELYSMRNELDKAYTINQFIFIVKPENINFLNKLV